MAVRKNKYLIYFIGIIAVLFWTHGSYGDQTKQEKAQEKQACFCLSLPKKDASKTGDIVHRGCSTKTFDYKKQVYCQKCSPEGITSEFVENAHKLARVPESDEGLCAPCALQKADCTVTNPTRNLRNGEK